MELSTPVTAGLELSAPVTGGLELSAPAPVTAALAKLLQYFCQGHLHFASWARVRGTLSLATDTHGQQHSILLYSYIFKVGFEREVLNMNC